MRLYIPLIILLCIACAGCSSNVDMLSNNSEQTTESSTTCTDDSTVDESSVPQIEQDVFEGYEFTADERLSYGVYFKDAYTVEQFEKFCNVARPMSAYPITPINDGVFIANQKIETYNFSETKYLILNINGDILKEATGGVTFDVQSRYLQKVGEFTFFKFYENNKDYFCIFNKDGIVCDTISVKESMQYIHLIDEIGNGYYLFANSGKSYDFYILTPEGKSVYLDFPNKYKSITDIPNIERHIEVGQLKENSFSLLQKSVDVCALYYRLDGTIIVDLSKEEKNITIKSLEPFEKGIAKIRFIGADYDWYNASIDVDGMFVEGPTKE